MRTLDYVVNVRDAEPVDDGCNLREGGACALAVEAGSLGDDPGRQSEMTARGFARKHDASRVDVVGFGLIMDIAQSAQAVFNGGGRNRDAREAVFNVHHVPS